MALTVEDGTGLATADSYVSLADAEAYVAEMGATWSGSDTEREALRRATAWLDGRYGSAFPGRRRNQRNQALLWPRFDAYDVENEYIEANSVPREIVRATIEAALREAAEPGALSPDVVRDKELTGLGDLSWTLVGTGPDAKRPVLTVVGDILSTLMRVEDGGTRTKAFLRA